jgi:hypothetical protein
MSPVRGYLFAARFFPGLEKPDLDMVPCSATLTGRCNFQVQEAKRLLGATEIRIRNSPSSRGAGRLGTRQLAAAVELDTLIDGEASFADQRRQQAAALQILKKVLQEGLAQAYIWNWPERGMLHPSTRTRDLRAGASGFAGLGPRARNPVPTGAPVSFSNLARALLSMLLG